MEWLDRFPLVLFFPLVCLATGLAMETGYRFGRWRRARTEGEKEQPVGAMVGSVLALFAFLLAFTFGMAGTRYEARRQAVAEEANAVGTTYLRARLLHEPQRTESLQLLREYVDVRVGAVGKGDPDVGAGVARSEEIQDRLWSEGVREAEAHPTPLTGLYLQSLNQVIDLHTRRVNAAMWSRIPLTIWGGLSILALLSMGSVGYQSGLAATRRSPAMLALVLAFSGVLYLIADLDSPREGWLNVSQQAMIDLQRRMARPAT